MALKGTSLKNSANKFAPYFLLTKFLIAHLNNAVVPDRFFYFVFYNVNISFRGIHNRVNLHIDILMRFHMLVIKFGLESCSKMQTKRINRDGRKSSVDRMDS